MTEMELLKVIAEAAEERFTELDLSSRRASRLPPEIGQLRNLTRLLLNYNQLTALPPEIGQLSNLGRPDQGRDPGWRLPLALPFPREGIPEANKAGGLMHWRVNSSD